MASRRAQVAAAALTLGFLLFGGWHWTRLEQPHIGARELTFLAILAVIPTVVAIVGGGRVAAALSLVVVTVAAIGHITNTWPWQTQHGIYPARVATLVVRGLRDWFGTHTPIDAGRFPGADHDLRLAFFAAAAALAWLLVRRGNGLLGIGVAFALFALPSTVLPLQADAFRAGLFLALALLTLVVTSERDGRRFMGDAQVVGLSVAVVVAGLVVGTAPGVTKSAFLDWTTWNPLANAGRLVNVNFMWNQTYAPLHWPKKRTQVIQVNSPTEMYWKAATLGTFEFDHWQFSDRDPVVGNGESRVAAGSDRRSAPAGERRPQRDHRQGEGARPGRRSPDRRRPAGGVEPARGDGVAPESGRDGHDPFRPAPRRRLQRPGLQPVHDSDPVEQRRRRLSRPDPARGRDRQRRDPDLAGAAAAGGDTPRARVHAGLGAGLEALAAPRRRRPSTRPFSPSRSTSAARPSSTR